MDNEPTVRLENVISGERSGRPGGLVSLRNATALASVILCLGAAQPALAHADTDVRIAALSKRIAAAPRNAGLHLLRGELYRVRRLWKRALADYDRAALLDPVSATPDLCRGRLWLEAGRAEPAKRFLTRFVESRPAHVVGRVMLARALVRLGERLAAARELDRAIRIAPDPLPEYYLERAAALGAEGAPHREEAVRTLDEGIERLGPLVTLELAAIDLEVDAGRADRALVRLERIAARSERKEPWSRRRDEVVERARRAGKAPAARREVSP